MVEREKWDVGYWVCADRSDGDSIEVSDDSSPDFSGLFNASGERLYRRKRKIGFIDGY